MDKVVFGHNFFNFFRKEKSYIDEIGKNAQKAKGGQNVQKQVANHPQGNQKKIIQRSPQKTTKKTKTEAKENNNRIQLSLRSASNCAI